MEVEAAPTIPLNLSARGLYYHANVRFLREPCYFSNGSPHVKNKDNNMQSELDNEQRF